MNWWQRLLLLKKSRFLVACTILILIFIKSILLQIILLKKRHSISNSAQTIIDKLRKLTLYRIFICLNFNVVERLPLNKRRRFNLQLLISLNFRCSILNKLLLIIIVLVVFILSGKRTTFLKFNLERNIIFSYTINLIIIIEM